MKYIKEGERKDAGAILGNTLNAMVLFFSQAMRTSEGFLIRGMPWSKSGGGKQP